MDSQLKIALIQADLRWQNAEQNRIQFSQKINEIKEHVDLIVLPEMFTTGFTMNPIEVAETMQGETVKWMQTIASEKNTAIAGSVVILENLKYYNRFLFVHPSGAINLYDKRHLFTLAGEHEVYTSGNNKLMIDYKGWKICPLICYDLRFPVWSRNIEGYDLLIYVANWPSPRISAWDALLKARAIENMSFTIGVNRVGIDANNLEYTGHSKIINPSGDVLEEISQNTEALITVSLSKNMLNLTRQKFQFLNDRDSFEMKSY
ncbi:MAG: amidohydrolase [Lutibacter sp.]|nr:MAG: amidohydrolase [Lutibacter sp.]